MSRRRRYDNYNSLCGRESIFTALFCTADKRERVGARSGAGGGGSANNQCPRAAGALLIDRLMDWLLDWLCACVCDYVKILKRLTHTHTNVGGIVGTIVCVCVCMLATCA